MSFLTGLIKHWLKPQSTDPDEMFRERTIRGMVLIIVFVMSVLIIQTLSLGTLDRLAQFFAVIMLTIAAQIAVNKGKIHTAAWIITLFGILFFAINIFQVGYWLPGTFIAAFLALLLGAMLLPARSTRIIGILMIVLYAGGSIWADSRGLVSPLPATNAFASPSSASITFAVVMLLLSGALSYLVTEFNARRAELRHLIDTLEERVANRTRDLNIAAQVAQQVNQVLDLPLLLPQLTELTRGGFNLYHVSVFLLDKNTQTLGLHAGTGEAGMKMVGQNKQFHLDNHGLVPRSAYLRQPQLSNDVRLSPDHFVNPLLPLTRSELAVPMIVGDEIIGVLDLQSEHPDEFSADDIRVLTTLAEQIAVAVRNAHLFADAQQARQEAEKANVVKSQFLASMSHELRTPLNAILNFTQFVSTGMMGMVNAEQVDMLDKVVHSGKHLLSLINDVLDISKIEAGALKLFVESDVNVAHEARGVADSAQGLLGEKAVSLHVQIPDGLPLISGDKRRIRQIMLNLVSNACKFTDEGSIRLVVEQHPDHLLFAVHDTGPGIAAEDVEAVFETFRQTSTGMREGGGTGLGLPISRRLAEAHGGNIWVESVLGQGTSFYVSLPINVLMTNDLLNNVKETSHVA